MAILISVMGGAFMTVGALSAVWFLLTLTARPIRPQIRAAARATSVTAPAARRDSMVLFCGSMVLTINGTFLFLNVQNEVAKWLATGTLTVLVIWQLRLMFVSRRQRQSAG